MKSEDFLKDLYEVLLVELKPLGFRKRGAAFVRENDDVMQAVQVQRSVSSSSHHVKVTLNFGLHSKAVDRIRGAIGPPALYDGGMHLFARVNKVLLDQGIDFWVEAYDEETAKTAISECKRVTRDYLIPFLEAASTSKGLLIIWTERIGLKPHFDRREIVDALSLSIEEKNEQPT